VCHDAQFFFDGTGVCTQGFALAEQVLHLSHIFSPFLLWLILEVESWELFAKAGLELQSF
jgi:hypothetical protein